MKQKVKIPLSSKFVLTFVPLFLFAMLMTIYAVHRTVTLQFTDRYEQSLKSSVESVERELEIRQHGIKQQLRELASMIRDDHDFRLYLTILDEVHNPYIVDYAPRYITTMGLQSLEIIDGTGLVLSSGQYRNAFGGNARSLVRNIQNAEDGILLAWFDHPDGYILCLTAIETFTVANNTYHIIGGTEVHPSFLRGLQPDIQNVVLLHTPARSISSDPERIAPGEIDFTNDEGEIPEWLTQEYSYSRVPIPVADRNTFTEGGMYLFHSRYELIQLLATLNEKIIAITAVGILFVIVLAFWQAGNVARPLRRLAYRAANISLESLDDNFNITSKDEVGILNNALKSMIQRLRKSRLDLAIAEQRAAYAEVARKVNHDIKNGFIPIRNVMHHWSEVAENEPNALVQVFKERRDTVNDSIQYLQEIAQNYAQTIRKADIAPVNINEIIDNVIKNYRDLPDKNITIEAQLTDNSVYVPAEKYQIRRAIENVIANAVEACGQSGHIQITTQKDEDTLVIVIDDDGDGIPPEVKEHLFHTHITTKEEGTGIGLMNTHSIIKQFKGKIEVSDREEGGACIRITLPVLNPETIQKENHLNEETAV